jgi:hypothetical protein
LVQLASRAIRTHAAVGLFWKLQKPDPLIVADGFDVHVNGFRMLVLLKYGAASNRSRTG